MNKVVVSNILRFLLLLPLQVLVCNYINFLGFINPYIYIIALMLLPLQLPRALQYLIAFATGFVVDIFAMTYGVHAFSSVLIIFLRPYIINLMTIGKKKLLELPLPGQKDFKWLLLYTLIFVFIHHFCATMLELFTFRRFWLTILVVIANTLFTTLLILCYEYLFIPQKGRSGR